MKPSLALEANCVAIRRIVAAHRATNPRVFGSVLHGEDAESSDLDLLVDPLEGTTLFDLGGIVYELEQLLGVPVDLLTPKAISRRFRDEVIAEARPV